MNAMMIALGVALMLVGLWNAFVGVSGLSFSVQSRVLGGGLAMSVGAITVVFDALGQGIPDVWTVVMGVLLAIQLWAAVSDVREQKRTEGVSDQVRQRLDDEQSERESQ